MRRFAALPAVWVLLCALASSQSLVSPAQPPTAKSTAILWKDPGNVKSLDLFYGPGGQKNLPHTPVKFVKEDLNGTSPKFDVRDSTGEKWKAKLGPEARPETVAARLLWAVGYAANENYFFSDLQVEKLPAELERGKNFVKSPDLVEAVRLQRHPGGDKKQGIWAWRHNPFIGTREFNGLRVMMALINNWDLKDENNAIYDDPSSPGRVLYAVTDVGSSFGNGGKWISDKAAKGDLKSYIHSKFISKITRDYVNFNCPKRPAIVHFLFAPGFFIREMHERWIARHIPRSDVRWIGSRLAQLSPQQIRDAFRAGGYPPDQVEAYARVVERRIAELQNL